MPNVKNVTTGKPKIGGAVYSAPTGSTLPTDATSTLDSAFVEMGYCSEDGVVNSDSRTIEQIKAWGGDTVLTPMSEKSDNFQMTLIEATNVEVLKAIYGSTNVSGTLADGIAIDVNAKEPEARAWVIDMIFAGGILKRIVIPNATIGELGDITYTDADPVGYEVTLYAMPDSAGDTHHEYIVAPSTSQTALDDTDGE